EDRLEARRREQEEERRNYQELVDAYQAAQEDQGAPVPTVGGSALPCPKAKSGVQVNLTSSDERRRLQEAKVTFRADGASLVRTTRTGSASLPLKKAVSVDVTVEPVKPKPAHFKQAQYQRKCNTYEGQLTTEMVTLEAKPPAAVLRVNLKFKGDGAAV